MSDGDTATKALCLVIDAASFPLVERFMAGGALPNLAAVAENGAWGPLEVNRFNCQTPAALASIFTGVPAENNNIGGFCTPDIDPGQPLTAQRASFIDFHIQAPLIWQWAAEKNRTVTLGHVPFSKKGTSYDKNILFSVCGYDNRICRGQLFALSELPWRAVSGDSPLQTEIRLGECRVRIDGWDSYPVGKHFSRLRITSTQSGHAVELKPEKDGVIQYRDLQVDNGCFAAVFTFYHPDNREIYLYAAGLYQLEPRPFGRRERFMNHTGAFQGEACGRFYRKGMFGKPLYDGGDGSAERLFSRLSAEVTRYFQRVSDFCLRDIPADLSLFYLPTIDEVSHEWAGFVDPDCGHFHSNGLYLELMASVYQDVDRWLGSVLQHRSPGTSVVILSDHGMSGCSRNLYLNTLLEQEGLLRFTATGEIDLQRTSVFFHPAENGAVCVNADTFPGGSVPAGDIERLKRNTMELLRNYRDPDTCEPVTYRVVDMGLRQMAHRHVYGDLFFVPTNGYSVKASAGPAGVICQKTFKSGTHHFNRGEEMMKGIYFIAGPALPHHHGPRPLSNLDIFPLLCRLLSIPLPPGLTESSRVRQLFSSQQEDR